MKTIYLDMDGVVANYDAGAERILGYSIPYATGLNYPEDDWKKIVQDERFYFNLPMMPMAADLVRAVHYEAHFKNLQIRFLSAIPHNNDMPWAFWDKIKWVEQHFPGIPVFFGPYSYDKWRHCQPGDVLIDDKPSNIDEWNSAGGVGILHTGDVPASIARLKQALDLS